MGNKKKPVGIKFIAVMFTATDGRIIRESVDRVGPLLRCIPGVQYRVFDERPPAWDWLNAQRSLARLQKIERSFKPIRPNSVYWNSKRVPEDRIRYE